jgi:hypothetical protein
MTTSNTPAPKAVEALPELPEPDQVSYVIDSVMRKYEVRTFTADQMREYARTAVSAALAAAQAEQTKPTDSDAWEWRNKLTGYWQCSGETSYTRHQMSMMGYETRGSALSPQPPSPDVELNKAFLRGWNERAMYAGPLSSPDVERLDEDGEPYTAERLAQWLDAKWRRHSEVEDKYAAEMLRRLSARSPQQEPKA